MAKQDKHHDTSPELHTDTMGTVKFSAAITPDDHILPTILTGTTTIYSPSLDISEIASNSTNTFTNSWCDAMFPNITYTTFATDNSGMVSDSSRFKIIRFCEEQILYWEELEKTVQDDDYMLGVCYGNLQAYQNIITFLKENTL